MKQLEVLQSQLLPLKKLKPNTGQIPGLPANPRRITDIQLARLKRSIQQNPEMLSIKEMMVYAYNGEYIVIDGNQRLTVLKATQYKEVPCKVIPANSTPEQLRAYLIKSDLQFGEWVDEMLSKDLDMQELDDFGMEDVERLEMNEIDETPDASDEAESNTPVPEVHEPYPVATSEHHDPSPVVSRHHEDEEEFGKEEYDEEQTPSYQNDSVLPAELHGVNLTPEPLPEIKGNDNVKMDRVIIVYRKDQLAELLGLLGLEKLDQVVYPLDKLLGGNDV